MYTSEQLAELPVSNLNLADTFSLPFGFTFAENRLEQVNALRYAASEPENYTRAAVLLRLAKKLAAFN
jgi:hypothetical protein